VVYNIGLCEDTEIIIPSVHNGLPVTGIADSAFNPKYILGEQKNIRSVYIPDSVTYVGYEAFFNCKDLSYIELGKNIKEIGSRAFQGTGYYNNLENWENDVLYIGAYLYEAKNTLQGEYEIKDGTVYIAKQAFSGCKALAELIIPASVRKIENFAFDFCEGLAKVYYQGDLEAWCGIEFMGDSANPLYYNAELYIDNRLLTEIVIPDSVTEIKPYTFMGWMWLTDVTIHENVQKIGFGSFAYTALTEITIPNTVVCIDCAVFYQCTELKKVTFTEKTNWTVADEEETLSLTAEEVGDTEKMATYLQTEYCYYTWTRTE
jgi:hypothetical protein